MEIDRRRLLGTATAAVATAMVGRTGIERLQYRIRISQARYLHAGLAAPLEVLAPDPVEKGPIRLRARPACFSLSRRWKDKDLAGVNQIWIANLFPVRLVNEGVARAHSIGVAAEAPEAVAAGDSGRCNLRHNHGGGRASVWQNGRHGGR